MARLAEAIELADSVRPLFNHPEVIRWFERSERALIEGVIAAANDEARGMAVAQIKALRDIRNYLTGVEVAAQDATKKLTELRTYGHAR